MAKDETKQTYRDTRADKLKADQRFDTAIDESNERAESIVPGMEGLRTDIQSGFSSLTPAGSLRPTSISAPVINTGNLKDVLGGYKSYVASNAGYNPEVQQSILKNAEGLEAIGATGGLDAEAINRMRGLGIYDEFAKTGGYTPEAIANIKAQALSPISSIASGTRDELARRRALTGGYAPGFDAANRALMRDTSRAITDTNLNANVTIQDRINEGRLAGVGGLTAAEGNLQTLKTGNQLTGLTQAANIRASLQERISYYMLQGLNGQQATARAIADIEAQNAQNAMSANMFNAGRQDNADRFNIENAQNVEGQSLAGLGNLYNTDIGQYQNELDRSAGLLGSQNNSNLAYLQNQSNLAVQPGTGMSILNGIGSVAGAVAPWFAA